MSMVKVNGGGTGIWLAVVLIATSTAIGQGDDRLVGVWDRDEGFRTVELLCRSDGRYQLETKSTQDSVIDFSSSERGQYQVEGPALTLTPYDYLIKPQPRRYQFERTGDSLSLTSTEFGQTQTQSFQFRSGSKADVLARETVQPGLVGIWRRHVPFYGDVECLFRPGGYYVEKRTPDNTQFASVYIRGRYEQSGNRLTLKPYSEAEEVHEMDFFGKELTLIKADDFSSESVTYNPVLGSETDVPVKAAEAEALLARTNWQVGVWEVRDANQSVDLTLRPDGRYIAELGTGANKEMVRGRYLLDSRRIHLIPFVGQEARTGGDFGNSERLRELDFYDGELQFIDLEAILQSVRVARKRPGSEASVTEAVRQAQAESAREDWWVGIWQVNDAAGWMEFTFRPDQRYIAKTGTKAVPTEVERGRFRLGANKLTLAPYPNLGEPRAFELDLYEGTLLLIGDWMRMVVARKVPGSEVTVAEATTNPDASTGTRGPLAGLWSLHLNEKYAAELLFRPDGQFRLARCAEGKLSHEYGLYSVNLPSRTLVLDSRLAQLVTAELDFYADTMTLVSTNSGFPATYIINPSGTDAALEASFAEDTHQAELSDQWLKRVPVGPRNPDVGQAPSLPFDFRPEHVLEGATVFTEYRHYQQLIPSYVGMTPVVNAQDWHFLRNGRVLIRFTQNRSEWPFPVIITEKIDTWGAYSIEPNRSSQDILHRYAVNSLRIETDFGEPLELTLEDGRRHLFWGKDRALLAEWAAEVQPISCQPQVKFDPGLMNTGISLRTKIAPDDLTEAGPIRFSLSRPIAGNVAIAGTASGAATLVTEQATSLTPPVLWQVLQTNTVPDGPFNFTIPASTNIQAFYRLRRM